MIVSDLMHVYAGLEKEFIERGSREVSEKLGKEVPEWLFDRVAGMCGFTLDACRSYVLDEVWLEETLEWVSELVGDILGNQDGEKDLSWVNVSESTGLSDLDSVRVVECLERVGVESWSWFESSDYYGVLSSVDLGTALWAIKTDLTYLKLGRVDWV